MALALDHFIRGTLITCGTLVVVQGDYKVVKQLSKEDRERLDELNGKIKVLGIDQSCFLENPRTPKVCHLNEEQMKGINFPEKEDDKDNATLTVTGLEDPKRITLTIGVGYQDDEFPDTLRFTFNNPNDVDVSIAGDETTTFKSHIDYDYKISLAETKRDKLLKAWSLQSLGGRAGLNINDSLENVCTVGENKNKVNVWKSEDEYVLGAETNQNTSCLMDAAKDTPHHLEGFKLTVKGDEDIALMGGTGPKNGTTISSIKKNNTSYSIGPKDVDGIKKWFLIENS